MTRAKYEPARDSFDDESVWPPGPDTNEPWIEDPTSDLFHIGQSYERTAAVTIRCSNCGGYSFNVGVGGCYTADTLCQLRVGKVRPRRIGSRPGLPPGMGHHFAAGVSALA